MYYVIIIVVLFVGNVEVIFDGVIVVIENLFLSDVYVFDGELCSFKGNDFIFV